MYIDATSVAAADRKLEVAVVRFIRDTMHPFEMQLERIQVQVTSSAGLHCCRLRAWAPRGQTVVIESTASSRWDALATATDRLKSSIAERAGRGRGVTSASGPASEAGAPASRGDARSGASSEAPVSAVARDGSAQGARVLLALEQLDPSSACVQWAQLLADSLRADLHVCRVLSDVPASSGMAPEKAWLETTRRRLGAARETRLWCAGALPGAALSDRVIAGGGDGVREAALVAGERGVDWIVMDDGQARRGMLPAALARASGCTVLVARTPTSRSTLLVSTDVSGDLYPLSRRAAALAEALHAPVLAFHDVSFRGHDLVSRVNAMTDAWSKIQAERIQAGGPQRLPELEVLLAHGADRVETILAQARREDAEIIIVGLGEVASPATDDAVANAVVDRALRSVLVVPPNLERSSGSRPPASVRSPSPPTSAERAGTPS